MRVLVTGAGGTVGRFVVPALEAGGHRVTTLGRHPGDHPWDLADSAPRLPPADALVHAALAHVPGAYRGGEGDDPARFRRLNIDGTRALFDAAGGARVVFLSAAPSTATAAARPCARPIRPIPTRSTAR